MAPINVNRTSPYDRENEMLQLRSGNQQHEHVLGAQILAVCPAHYDPGFLPLIKMTFFKGDVTKDLAISEVTKRQAGTSLEIIGLITNSGSHKWSSVNIEAEFFDAAGGFVDEQTESLRSEVAPGAKEHFKITLRNPDVRIQAAEAKMVVKIAGGYSMPF